MPSPRSIQWPQDLLDQTRELYESGKYSNARIALMIGNGKSRNAVIGIANRQGWINPHPAQGGTKAGEKRPRRTDIFRPRPNMQNVVSQPLAPVDAPLSLDLTILELTNRTCRFPHGDQSPYYFCGHPTLDDAPYCEFHRNLCWTVPPPRRGGQFAVKQFR